MATVKKPTALPVSFEQFKKNPVAAVAFCMLAAVSYLYLYLKSGYKDQIQNLNIKLENYDVKLDKMNYALKRSDSTLASAITELRIITTVKKL
jgi:hypothetical protein